MLFFILKRIAGMIPAMLAISVLAFTVIQLPPGDYVSTYAAQIAQSGERVDDAVSSISNGSAVSRTAISATASNGASR